MKNGSHEKVNYMYDGHEHMVLRVKGKDQQLNTLKLCITNDSRLLHGHAVALDDHKQLLHAFRDGKQENLGWFLRVGMKRGLGSYEKEDYLQGIVYWQMGGVWMAEFAHCANRMPGITAIQANSAASPIIPSPAIPLFSKIMANTRAVLDVDTVVGPEDAISHQVFMLDEIATEQRIRYDDQTNYFLGVCREHAGNVTLEFNNVMDVEQLYKSLDDGEVHHATEATIGAIGILSSNKRLYNACPILVLGTCKRETGLQQAKVIQTGLDALDSIQPKTRLQTVSLSSNGETKWGKAFEFLTFKHELAPESDIFQMLSPLKYLNLLVGNDDLTCDKDFCHVFKRTRDLLLHPRGMNIMDVHLLQDLWGLPASTSSSPCIQAEREAIKLIGTLFYEYLVLPYICIKFLFSEQLQHLSSAAFLLLVLYRRSGKDFIPTLLYQDIQIMVKNALFCVAKSKIDISNGRFWLLIHWLTGTTELANILAEHPEWDQTPRQILGSTIDHISPATWKGDVQTLMVLLLNCWKVDDNTNPAALTGGTTTSVLLDHTLNVFGEESGIRKLKDVIAEEIGETALETVPKFSPKTLDNEKLVNKSRFLSQFVHRHRYNPSSTDCLQRVQQMS
ncbi:hypothetical protein BDP27DRAFT_1382615 [Rhodocollybia butyracea]|uniref:Uncharacterized protein n=1 Tax=Rhodocollybia butyracea TaxID=206335 RepID=A0A9P5PXE4_9AGAR|nr:hypothetical protein BDP27DRAFT_1382615 [Rhodocollybia butyracea]